MTLEFDQGDMPSQNGKVEEADCLHRFTKHLHPGTDAWWKMQKQNESQQFLMEIYAFVAQGILAEMQCIRNW